MLRKFQVLLAKAQIKRGAVNKVVAVRLPTELNAPFSTIRAVQITIAFLQH